MCVSKEIYRGPVVDIQGKKKKPCVRCSKKINIYTQNQVITFELEQKKSLGNITNALK